MLFLGLLVLASTLPGHRRGAWTLLSKEFFSQGFFASHYAVIAPMLQLARTPCKYQLLAHKRAGESATIKDICAAERFSLFRVWVLKLLERPVISKQSFSAGSKSAVV